MESSADQIIDQGNGKEGEKENCDEDSEDQGLYFDNIISPGGEHLNFGSFQNMEIRNVWSFKTIEGASIPMNVFGMNLSKSKFDLLVAVEAKNALTFGKEELRNYLLRSNPTNCSLIDKVLEQ